MDMVYYCIEKHLLKKSEKICKIFCDAEQNQQI